MGGTDKDKICRLCKHCKTQYYICNIDNKHKDTEDTCEQFKSINVRAIRAFSKAIDKVQDLNSKLENFAVKVYLPIIIVVIVIAIFVGIIILVG